MDVLEALLTIAATLVFSLGFAVVVRRMLGVPVSLVRAVLAALVAGAAARPLLNVLVGEPADDGVAHVGVLLYLSLLIAFGVVLAMLLLVVAEMLVPDASLPGPIELWRSWRGRLARRRRDRDLVVRLWHQGLLTVIAATSGIMAARLLTIGPGPSVAPGIEIFWVLGAALLCISVILALRVLMAVLRRTE